MKNSAHNLSADLRTLVIVGVGLIGGSLARAARARGLFTKILGVGRNSERLQKAVEQGIIDSAFTNAEEAVRQADLVIVCTPVDQIARDVLSLYPHLPEKATITDAGSTKRNICEQITAALGTGHRYIGSHPMAGSEKTGFEYASETLFERATIILTPEAETPPDHLQKLQNFWQALGGELTFMAPHEHDLAVAMTSHLPHLVSSALAATVTEKDLPLAASGFGDTTRIAAGSPQLWTSIFMENSEATLQAAEEFQRRLATLITALKSGNIDRLTSLLEAGKRHRDRWQAENHREH